MIEFRSLCEHFNYFSFQIHQNQPINELNSINRQTILIELSFTFSYSSLIGTEFSSLKELMEAKWDEKLSKMILSENFSCSFILSTSFFKDFKSNVVWKCWKVFENLRFWFASYELLVVDTEEEVLVNCKWIILKTCGCKWIIRNYVFKMIFQPL